MTVGTENCRGGFHNFWRDTRNSTFLTRNVCILVFQHDYIQHPLLYELGDKYGQPNENVPEAMVTCRLEELKEHIRKEIRKELKIKEGAERLRGVSTDKKTLSDVASMVKKSNARLNEMQADLQELESQIILTHGQSTQSSTRKSNSLGDLTCKYIFRRVYVDYFVVSIRWWEFLKD